jgi:transcriptional regulator with XRE-family HTH domain
VITPSVPTRRVYSAWPAPNLLPWRRYRMLTQRELASRSGVDVATIVRGEHQGALQRRTLERLAKALRCKIDDLVGDESD